MGKKDEDEDEYVYGIDPERDKEWEAGATAKRMSTPRSEPEPPKRLFMEEVGEHFKDWINRSQDTFVHEGDEMRSGWAEEAGSRSVARFLMGDGKELAPEKKAREVYKLCRNRLENVSGGVRTTLVFDDEHKTASTDGKRVTVGTGIIDDERYTTEEMIDIILGITTHEAAHVLYSDIDEFRKIKDPLKQDIWNIIEDERIEHTIGEDFPGYAYNIERMKNWLFNDTYVLDKKRLEEEIAKGSFAPMMGGATALTERQKKAAEIYDSMFKFIRFPKYLDAAAVEDNEQVLIDIKDALTPYPVTQHDITKSVEKVTKIMRKAIDKEFEEEEEEEKEKAEEEKKTLMSILSAGSSSFDSSSVTGEPITASEHSHFDPGEEIFEDIVYKATYRKAKPDKTRYQELKSEIKLDAQLLARAMYVHTFNEKKALKGMRSGHLDDSKIVEAAHGVKTVHMSFTEKVTKRVNVAVLIDESGSMRDGIKDRNAAKVGVLLEYAFDLYAVGQLFIYGFTSDNGEDFNTVYRYREPGLNVKFGLGSSRGRSNNRDGHCIRSVANRIRTFTKEPMIYFIISDGQPSAGGYGGAGAIEDTRRAVEKVKGMNFFPIQIGIGSGLDEATQAMMFTDYIKYNDSKSMVIEIRKLLMRKAKKYVGV